MEEITVNCTSPGSGLKENLEQLEWFSKRSCPTSRPRPRTRLPGTRPAQGG